MCLEIAVLLYLMVIVYASGNTKNTCPDRVLWRRVALMTCPSNPDYYHCLERIGKDRFETVCRHSTPDPKGYYKVLDEINKNFDARKCPRGTYQPNTTFSSVRNMCDYQKTRCNEKGQITFSYGTTKEDSKCRCDYRHGYTFVQTPVNTCYCIPSQEDCSCYRETCNDSGLVNQDYNCLDPSDIGNKIILLQHIPVKSYNNNYRGKAVSFIILLIFIYIGTSAYTDFVIYNVIYFVVLIAVLICIWWRYHKYKGALKIKTYRDHYTVNIGVTVTLMTHVKEFGSIADFIFGRADIAEVKWTKHTETTEVNVTPDNYSNEDDQYLKIEKLKFEDEAEYKCTVTNQAGHVFISRPIKVEVLGSAGRVLLQNIPEEIQKFGKSATEEYRRLLKTEVHKQKTIHLVIFGPKESGKTSLWHNLLGIEQEETSQDLLQKYCVKIQDGKCDVTDYSASKVNNIIKSKMKSIKTEEVEVIDVIIREVPGQLEYCAVLAPFISRHAIFILTTDVIKELWTENRRHTFSNPALERDPRFHLRESGELVRDWINIIHSLKPADQDSSTNQTLQPSIVLVGTHKDKFQFMKGKDLNKRHKREVYNCVYDKKFIISKHVIHSCVITNHKSHSEEIQILQDIIMKGSGFAESWHDEIPVRYLWFEEILLNQRSKTDVMSFDEVLQLGKDHGYPVTDKQEFRSFLSHQHKVRNIIYWEDISKYVIISPSWLNGIITKLITIFQNEANAKSDYCKTGQIAVDVLDEIIKSNKGQSAEGVQDTVDLLQTFEIIVSINKKSSEHDILYVPFVIPDDHTADVVTMFETDRRNKTSFLSFSFDFLPAALVNHIMIRLIGKYQVCEVPSQNGNVAIYYRTLVLEYNPHKNQKLYFLSLKDELLFQMWIYGVQQISECFESLREKIEDMVTRYKSRHKMNLNFTHKLKCPDSKHATEDVWNVLFERPDRTYYCHDHRKHHEDLYSVWFTSTQESSRLMSKKLDFSQYGGQETSDKPTITLSTTSYQVRKGSKVTLQCQVKYMMRAATVTWIRLLGKQEVKIPSQKSVKHSGVTLITPSLTIYNLTEEDSGLYWCEATDSNGLTRSDMVQVEVTAEFKETRVMNKETKLGTEEMSVNVITEEKNSSTEDSFHSIDVSDVSDDDNGKSSSDLDVPSDVNSAQEHKGKLTNNASDRVVTDQDEVVDAVVIHGKQDKDSAMEFIDHLYSLKDELDIPNLKVILHSDITIPGAQFLHTFNGLFDKARFVMIIITERFKDSRLERFCAEKTLMESLMDEDKLFRVIPISMAGPQHMPEEFFPLIAVQYYRYRVSELKGKKDLTYICTLRKLFQNDFLPRDTENKKTPAPAVRSERKPPTRRTPTKSEGISNDDETGTDEESEQEYLIYMPFEDPLCNTVNGATDVDVDQAAGTLNVTGDDQVDVVGGQGTGFGDDGLPSVQRRTGEPTPVSDDVEISATGQGTEEDTSSGHDDIGSALADMSLELADVPTEAEIEEPPQRQRHRRILPTPPRPPPESTRPQRDRRPPAYLKDYVTTSKQARVVPEWERKVNWLEEQAAKGRFDGLEFALSRTILEIMKTAD